MTEAEKMNAYIWAAKVDSEAIPMLALNKGDVFVWPHNREGNRKTYCGRGWFEVGGKRYRSCIKTAVVKVNQGDSTTND